MTIRAVFPFQRNLTAQTAYDQIAPTYDAAFTRPVDIAENRFVFNRLKDVISGRSVLDVGCGTGIVLEYCWPVLYSGIDISGAMIEKARLKFPGRMFHKMGMERLAWPDNSFDAVVSTFGSFSYSLDPVQAASEMLRVLRPGGRLFLQVLGGRYTRRAHHVAAFMAPFLTYDTRDLESLFSEVGFVTISVEHCNLMGDTFPGLLEWESRVLGPVLGDRFYYHIVTGSK